MFQNYFKTAVRALARHKSYAIINIAGLAVGIAACLLIYTVVRYETSFDTFRTSYNSIYHVVTEDDGPDGVAFNPGIPCPAREALRTDLPGATIAAIHSCYGSQVTIPDPLNKSAGKKFIEPIGLFFMDPEFFEIFGHRWLAGDKHVLADPGSAVLSKATAEKYFGSWKNALGKTIRLDNATELKVNGILENTPDNSDFNVLIAGSFATLRDNSLYGYNTDWGSTSSNFQLYMKLPENTKAEQVNAQLVQLANKYYKNKGPVKRHNFLRPLREIHFDTRMSSLGDHVTSRSVLLTLSFIALLIIVMACINFINLSTAQAVNRSREVGVRKVMGGNRMQLFWQMMSETFLIVLASTVIGCLSAKLLVPYLNNVITIPDSISLFTPGAILFMICIVLGTTLLSGLYPALVLSGLKPISAIRNKASSASIGGIPLRRALVVTQFAISQVLIIGTIVAVGQMDFVREADLGFNKETILNLGSSTERSVRQRNESFRQSLLSVPGVQSVSFNSDAPSSDNNWGTNFAFDHHPDEHFTLYLKMADVDYFNTYGIQFLAGGPYRKSDTVTDVVVNESLLKRLNVKNPVEAIGKDLRTGAGPWRKICGVIKDFKTNSLKDEIKPLMIASAMSSCGLVTVKLKGPGFTQTVKTIEQQWDRFFPELVYSSTFLDEAIANFYHQENQLALLYKLFAGLAVFISCLGLYGLVSFMVVQKTKEVGIRKVLGARTGNIVYLFSREFTVLILIAFAIAGPVAWYFMNEWLGNFVFRIKIGPGVFIIAVLSSILLAWIAVGYKAIKAALANPVKSLRTE